MNKLMERAASPAMCVNDSHGKYAHFFYDSIRTLSLSSKSVKNSSTAVHVHFLLLYFSHYVRLNSEFLLVIMPLLMPYFGTHKKSMVKVYLSTLDGLKCSDGFISEALKGKRTKTKY